MAQHEATNAHFHKVLSHRNYMYHVSLQKQLHVYEKQKKLVEKELNEITKVRKTIQHINRNLTKKSPTIKKRVEERHGSPKKAKSSESLLIENGMAMDKKELTKQEAKHGNLCSEDESNSGKELQLFGPRNKSNSHQSLLMKSEKMVEEMKEQFENEIVNGEGTPRILRKEEAFEESSSDINFKSNIEQITPVSIEHQRKREKLPEAEEIADSSNINNEKTNEDEKKLRNQPTPHSGNIKHFTPRRPLYKKSCSAPSIPVQKLKKTAESETKVSERCEIHQLTKRPAGILNEKSYSNSDENLYKKTLLENHLKEGIKLPLLGDRKHDTGTLDGNTDKGNGFQSEKRGCLTSSSVLGAYSNDDYCFVERSRHRQRSVCNVQTTKPKFAWHLAQGQGIPAQLLNTFPTEDICPLGPRARSETVCMDDPSAKSGPVRSKTVSFHTDNRPRSARVSDWFQEGTRPRSKSEIGSAENWKKNGVKTPANLEYGRNRSGSNDTVSLTEDESIAIKGKFKQIGHSVLAIALMKKMTSTK